MQIISILGAHVPVHRLSSTPTCTLHDDTQPIHSTEHDMCTSIKRLNPPSMDLTFSLQASYSFLFFFFFFFGESVLDISGCAHCTKIYIVLRTICRRRAELSRAAYACVLVISISITRTRTICSELVAIRRTLVAISRYTHNTFFFITYLAFESRVQSTALAVHRQKRSRIERQTGRLTSGESEHCVLCTQYNNGSGSAAARCTYVYLHNLNGVFCRRRCCWFLFVMFGFITGLAVAIDHSAKAVVVQITRKMHFTIIRVGS